MPDTYAVKGVQFAFHYVNKNSDIGQLAIDNVKLVAVDPAAPAENHTITASAGEGGTISPSGSVSVADGADQTFTIQAADGYQIADVLVDGSSVGAVESYTFSAVTADHTISASFEQKAADVQFDNDFEEDEFPGHG